MKIGNDLKIFVDRRFLVNSYLLTIEKTCVLIDPGLNAKAIESFIQANHLILVGIILTHGHYDHIGNTFDLARKYQVQVYLHQDEKLVVERHNFAKELNLPIDIDFNFIQYFQDVTLTIGKFVFSILLLKGHTPGGIILRYHNYLFSGDTVFYDSVGRTDLMLGDPKQMEASLKLFYKYCNDTD
jgi:glyoxylase-like metal-dependent hydrolase (beta-lactamase superfamily II)